MEMGLRWAEKSSARFRLHLRVRSLSDGMVFQDIKLH
jgi:hypothetical protein